MLSLTNTPPSLSTAVAPAWKLAHLPANNGMPGSDSERQEALDALGCYVQSVCSIHREKFSDNHTPCRQAIDTSKARLAVPADVDKKFEQCITQTKFCASKKFPTKDLRFQLEPCGNSATISAPSFLCWGVPGNGKVVCKEKIINNPVPAVSTEKNSVGTINKQMQTTSKNNDGEAEPKNTTSVTPTSSIEPPQTNEQGGTSLLGPLVGVGVGVGVIGATMCSIFYIASREARKRWNRPTYSVPPENV